MKYFYILFIIIFLHELGHLLSALVLRIKVLKFFVFLNPWFSIFKFKIKNTEIGLGWIPLGGYIQIEERNIYNWKLFVFYFAGVFVNIIFGVCITGCDLSWLFVDYIQNNLHFNSFRQILGFTSIIVALVNLLPFQGTDGAKMLNIIRKRKWD